jgi:hypothetical protein
MVGEQLLREYEEAKRLGGMKAQVRLAILTRMSAPRAKDAPDSAENLAIFREAMLKLAREEQCQGKLV